MQNKWTVKLQPKSIYLSCLMDALSP
uniref:Uncharacterized protein n=1 Tax=Rhizophora mucronata TaxID=61149 RepID=A0A2P2NX50_RHIMU